MGGEMSDSSVAYNGSKISESPGNSALYATQKKVDILILGAGWTSTFLIPLLEKEKFPYAATSTTGRDGTYKFKFEPSDEHEVVREGDREQYEALPTAKTILITFPLRGQHQSKYLRSSYLDVHNPEDGPYQFIQLGSTGIFTIPGQDSWVTRHSRYDETNDRAIAEDELRKLGGCVLDLSGLWGGTRQPKNWVSRVAPTKEKLGAKGTLHLIHGQDVANAILGVHRKFNKAAGERFMLTDLQVYDWWALTLRFAGEAIEANEADETAKTQTRWVGELMAENKVRALPRSMEALGRCYDTREFWTTFGIMPSRSGI